VAVLVTQSKRLVVRADEAVQSMNFSFEVGVNEQHRIDFSFDQFMGNLEIKVDGQTMIRDFRTFSLKLTKRYELTVGIKEQHSVVIEKKRKLFLAGVRPQQYRVFIDGQLVQIYEG
jgi:hypothetical protein